MKKEMNALPSGGGFGLGEDNYPQMGEPGHPLTVGRVAFGPPNSHQHLNFGEVLKNVAKVDRVERESCAANEAGNTHVPPDLKNDTLAMREMFDKYVRFVPVAKVFAGMSKMPGTNVGCVVLGDAMQVLASGWNGAARGCNADCDHRLETRELRLTWVVHAEVNAIANAARTGVSLEGGVLICTLMPCMACAKLIVQSGINLVLCPTPLPKDERWFAEFDLTRALFAECAVDLVHYDD